MVTMSWLTDAELYARGADTLIASWEAYARGAVNAAVQHLPGVTVAVFPNPPERGVYNNALLDRDLGERARASALAALETSYTSADVAGFAAWAHATDLPLRGDLENRGYTVDTTTRAMSMSLDELRLPRPAIRLEPATWPEYLRAEGLPSTFLAGADHAAFHVLAVRAERQIVATALAYDHGSDCGIYNVSTHERFRRRGLGAALTVTQLHDARVRGCRTASLQASAMAEGVYAAAGFRDLGQIMEYTPGDPSEDAPSVPVFARQHRSGGGHLH